MNKSLPDVGTVKYVTIEKVNNGFLITIPENLDDEKSCKYIKPTMNGVVSFMEKIWSTKVIQLDKSEKITEETKEDIPIRRKT